MSWDVLLLRLPEGVRSTDDIPDDFACVPLGAAEEVRALLLAAVPETDFSDPVWGELAGPTWSVELNVGSDDPVQTIMLHIRGSGDDVLPPVFRMAAALRCRALDCSSGELLDEGGTGSWHEFQAFRDRISQQPG